MLYDTVKGKYMDSVARYSVAIREKQEKKNATWKALPVNTVTLAAFSPLHRYSPESPGCRLRICREPSSSQENLFWGSFLSFFMVPFLNRVKMGSRFA